MQRVDVLKNGKRWIVDQSSSNPAVIARVTAAMQSAGRLEIVRHAAPPPPPPPPPHPVSLGQRCVYMSSVTDAACATFAELGPGYTMLFSADRNQAWSRGGSYYATDAQIATARSRGGKVASWCDGDQTPISYALKLRDDRGLDFASAQFETVEQWHLLRDSGLPLGIGNPSALKGTPELAEAIERVNAGVVSLVGEAVQVDPAYSAQGIDVASVCFYVDRDDNIGGYQPLERFSVQPAGQRRVCSIYTGGRMTPDDWKLYAAWTRP